VSKSRVYQTSITHDKQTPRVTTNVQQGYVSKTLRVNLGTRQHRSEAETGVAQVPLNYAIHAAHRRRGNSRDGPQHRLFHGRAGAD